MYSIYIYIQREYIISVNNNNSLNNSKQQKEKVHPVIVISPKVVQINFCVQMYEQKKNQEDAGRYTKVPALR